MKNKNSNDFIQINKAILTPEIIQCLEKLQTQDNFGLHAICNDITTAICFLGRHSVLLEDDNQEEIMNIIAALSQAKKTIEELRKPVVKN